MKSFLIICLVAITVRAHDEYLGKCPEFKAMNGFDWDKFHKGIWYGMEKFDTSSKCLTYEFQGGDGEEMVVEQKSTLTGLAKLSLKNKAIYRGRLVAPYSSDPGNMIVRFPLSLFGTASFVVLDTDYDNFALVCTCQSTKIFIEVLTFHRRSCTILQRRPIRDEEISKKLHKVLNDQIPTAEDEEKADHDFDVISHNNCDYSDDDKGIKIDVDKIIGSTQGEISDVFDKAVEIFKNTRTTTTVSPVEEGVVSEITEESTSSTTRFVENMIENSLPLQEESPKV